MNEKNKVSWFTILSALFSGIGIKLIDWTFDLLKRYDVARNIMGYKNTIMFGSILIIFIICILINYWHYKKEFGERLAELVAQFENSVFEIQSAQEELEELIAMVQYANRKYEELDEFYKKISSVVHINDDISDSLISRYIDILERIIADNTSIEYEKINISIFERKKHSKDTYTIRLSNYHTSGTIKTLELGKKSFVASVFKTKKNGYIPDISNRKTGVPFVEREGRDFETICGIPYVVDDECIAVVVITMHEPDSLNGVVSSYMKLVERYVQVIGFLLMFSDKMEE